LICGAAIFLLSRSGRCGASGVCRSLVIHRREAKFFIFIYVFFISTPHDETIPKKDSGKGL
jgi:hypothetical protein